MEGSHGYNSQHELTKWCQVLLGIALASFNPWNRMAGASAIIKLWRM